MLPGFAATPTFNLGALNGAALDSSVQAVKTALGSPFQAGGAIANTSFGISGTLPAFATTPTFNVGTIPAVVLAAGSNAIGTVSISNFPSTQPVSIAGASGTPYQPSTTVGTTSGALTFSPPPTAFIKLCVPSSASNGIWVRWDGGTATASAPAEYMPPGQCDSWVKATGFLPTGTINAIASASVGVSLIYY
jgi:hypothetical protein